MPYKVHIDTLHMYLYYFILRYEDNVHQKSFILRQIIYLYVYKKKYPDIISKKYYEF